MFEVITHDDSLMLSSRKTLWNDDLQGNYVVGLNTWQKAVFLWPLV